MIVWCFIPETRTSSSPDEKLREAANGKSIQRHSGLLAFIQNIDWHNVWDLFLVRFLLGCAVLVSRSNFTMLLEYKYSATPSTVGYVISYGSIVATIAGWFVGRISKFYQNDSQMLRHAAITQMFSLLAIAMAPSLWVMILCSTPLNISSAIARVSSTNLTIMRSHRHETGTLLGLGASVMSIARMLAPFFGGLAQEASVSGSTFLGAAFSALGSLMMLTVVHKGDSKLKVP